VTLAVALRWGAFVAGGSDSHCYLAQSRAWLDGSMLRPFSPGFAPGWTNASLSLTPIGFVPSPVVPGGIAPICPPGFGMFMAAAAAVGGAAGPFAIVPLCGALAIWCVYVLGRRLAGSSCGLIAGVLALASPIFLFQLLQPMSDVPAAAAVLASLALAARGGPLSSFGAGLAASAGLVIRPNLAPVAIALAPLVIMASSGSGVPRRGRVRALAWFGAGLLPGVLTVAFLNDLVYGSALASGYGDPSELFSVAHIAGNSRRYTAWLLQTQSPWVLLALVAPLVVRRQDEPADDQRGATPSMLAWACLASTAILGALYLPYVEFDDWSYLRFLLPAVLMLIVLSTAVTIRAIERLPGLVRAGAMFLFGAGLLAFSFQQARAREVYGIGLSEARFVDAATWVRDHTPSNAVVIAVWFSGSVRFHGERLTVLWDALEPRELDDVIQRLGEVGRQPYLLLESWEVPRFKQRFQNASRFAALDWPPRAEIGRDIALYDFADRDRFFRGSSVRSERVWTTAERRRLGRR
jgi:hypothetical protein